ncbi:MAG: hypothetical protein HKO75_03490 [Flavobacteriaceae bacterium]|nr:hypothetical protein [Muriicola sp.]MBT8289802.1 hypothetical protein [Muriicola sp.]NNC61713.1 hypothetical protein [Eudoraea sp.]NNK34996.1 hypothetical protein [Eudoraea sp.]NNL38903.1 hypothetical protein [Flavobacteriaceae bacterium]
MKNVFKYSVFSLLFMATLMVTSCQEEFEELPQPDEQQTIMASSSTALLIEKTTSNDGSYDNIVDGASCFALNFPYTVEVNGIEITIDSREDLHVIEEIFDAIEDDVDVLEIIFPITITFSDFSEEVINNKEELRALAEGCIEGGDDDDIECIDFVYPITLYTFDINEQQTGSVTVNSDRELRLFFKGLDDDDLISIDFPVTLELYDGTLVTVRTNAELAAAIENAKEACDEDDDNDYNDDDFTLERFNNLITECPWLVNEVQRDAINQTDQYFEYLMNFTEDGAVTVKDRLGNVLNGTWSTRITDHGVLVNLEFDVLVDFNLEWFVYEIEPGKIKLYAEGGNRIILRSVCDVYNEDPNTLREILRECAWVIKKVKNNGVEIDRLLGYEFKFMAEGVTLSNGVNTSTGSWEITTNAQGRLVMALTFGEDPNDPDRLDPNPNEIYFEWLLSDLRNDRLKFDIEGTAYELILQRVCEDAPNTPDGDVLEIRNVMMGGEWIVAQYKEGEMDETQNYMPFTFGFGAEHVMSITTGQTGVTQAGVWRVLRNSEGKLKVYLNAGVEGDLAELTDDWDFDDMTKDEITMEYNRIVLKSYNDTNASYDVLVFEKL